MLNRRLRARANLIDMYWSTLRRQRVPEPPPGLDDETAELIVQLNRQLAPDDPSAAFIDQLWQRIAAVPDPNASRAWQAPAVDPATRRRADARPSNEREEQHVISELSTTTDDAPIPIGQRRWTREAFKLVAAAIVFGLIGAILALTLRGDDDRNVAVPVPTPTPIVTPSAVATPLVVQPSATTSVPTPAATQLPSIEPVVTTILAGQTPWGVAAGAGSVWVNSHADGIVSRIDPATNAVVATIEVSPPRSRTFEAIVADDTAVWVMAGTTSLVRIDPTTNEVVATIPVDPPVDSLVLDDGVLWTLTEDSNVLRRFDTTTNSFTATTEIVRPLGAIATEDAIWVLHDVGRGTDSEILKLDPATGAVVDTVSLDNHFSWNMRVEGDSLWVPTSNSALLEVDIETSRVVATYPYPEAVPSVPLITTGHNSVWICNCTNEPDDVVWQFDIETRQWRAAILVGDVNWEGWLVFFNGALWSVNDENEIVRFQLAD